MKSRDRFRRKMRAREAVIRAAIISHSSRGAKVYLEDENGNRLESGEERTFRELPDMMSAIFLEFFPPSPLSAFGPDLFYNLAYHVLFSMILLPSPMRTSYLEDPSSHFALKLKTKTR